ncbi:MAG TPA: hypothetical protein PK513_08225 [Alphaproteobacteria bacterium]|nr:hypothetical protein [Alphaproteobacteria bacterium]USO06488.1 MAG: hypothetical protein H6859_04735 [Rhodospirillales bacterium]HOO82473.1 hypothetical protein [Alphaproteobacteria bacterium]
MSEQTEERIIRLGLRGMVYGQATEDQPYGSYGYDLEGEGPRRATIHVVASLADLYNQVADRDVLPAVESPSCEVDVFSARHKGDVVKRVVRDGPPVELRSFSRDGDDQSGVNLFVFPKMGDENQLGIAGFNYAARLTPPIKGAGNVRLIEHFTRLNPIQTQKEIEAALSSMIDIAHNAHS